MLESLISVSLFTVVASVFITSFMIVSSERIDLEKKRIGLTLLQERMEKYLYDFEEPFDELLTVEGSVYEMKWIMASGELVKSCIQWEGVSRNQIISYCIFGKRV